MFPDFNCIATGIGSLPHTVPDIAVALSLKYLPEAPIWPQLPQRSFLEHFCGQYSEGLPGLVVDRSKQSYYFDTSRDLDPELERFYDRYLAKDHDYFRISESHAAGLYSFIATLKEKGLPLVRSGINTHPNLRLSELSGGLEYLMDEFDSCSLRVSPDALPKIERTYIHC